MSKILVSGYFGFRNMGDEAILKGLIEGIRREEAEAEIVVLSSDPEFTESKYPVRAIERMDFYKIDREMRNMDLFISGGGSLLQDVTSSRSLHYYLALLTLAKKRHKKKTMIYSQGIGPVNGSINRSFVAKVLNQVDVINVRDAVSEKTLKDMGVSKPIYVTADTVFSISPPELTKGGEVLRSLDFSLERVNIGISLRPWKNFDEKIRNEMIRLLALLSETKKYNILLLPFHFNEDMKLISEIYQQLGENKDCVKIPVDELYVDEYLSLMGTMDIVVAMRLHGLIFSVLMGAVPIGISYDPKIDSFLKEIQSEDRLSVENIDAEKLYEMILQKTEDMEEEKRTVLEKRERLAEIANRSNLQVKNLLANRG